MFGLTAIILVQIGGGVLDYARAYSDKRVAQNALDAAALALMSDFTKSNNASQSKTVAEGYIHQNLHGSEGWKWEIGDVKGTDAHLSLELSGTKNWPTVFMRLFAIDKIPLRVVSKRK